MLSVDINGPWRVPLEAGALVRREVRIHLFTRGITFTEDRGWLSSVFFIDVPAGQCLHLELPDVNYQKQERV
jgi:hypothetical protein